MKLGSTRPTGGNSGSKRRCPRGEVIIPPLCMMISKSYIEFLNTISYFRLYIYGGEDIMSGHLNNMWSIDLSDLTEFVAGSTQYTENPEWQ